MGLHVTVRMGTGITERVAGFESATKPNVPVVEEVYF